MGCGYFTRERSRTALEGDAPPIASDTPTRAARWARECEAPLRNRCCNPVQKPIFYQEMRYLILTAFVLLLVGQHAVLALIPVDECCESDEATSPEGCATSCPLCVCCLDRTPVDAPQVDIPAPSLAPAFVLTLHPDMPPSPEPAEILHIPKPSLA